MMKTKRDRNEWKAAWRAVRVTRFDHFYDPEDTLVQEAVGLLAQRDIAPGRARFECVRPVPGNEGRLSFSVRGPAGDTLYARLADAKDHADEIGAPVVERRWPDLSATGRRWVQTLAGWSMVEAANTLQ